MSHKYKVVFDTNIFISGIVYGGAPLMCIDIAREGKIDLFTSNTLVLELLIKLRDKFNWEDDELKKINHQISTYAKIVTPAELVDVIKIDPTDDKVLEVAKEVNADFIVTGDKKHILPLRIFEQTEIVTASEFIRMFEEN